MVRRRVIASARESSPAAASNSENFTPSRSACGWTLAISPFTAGKLPDQVPFLHVDRLQAELKIISLLSTTVGLHSLVLDHPVVHIIVYPDGTTNAAVPA